MTIPPCAPWRKVDLEKRSSSSTSPRGRRGLLRLLQRQLGLHRLDGTLDHGRIHSRLGTKCAVVPGRSSGTTLAGLGRWSDTSFLVA